MDLIIPTVPTRIRSAVVLLSGLCAMLLVVSGLSHFKDAQLLKLNSYQSAVAANLDKLAQEYESQGRYQEAEPLCKRALAIREKLLGPNHPVVATELNNLAVLYDKHDKYSEAEPLFNRALAVKERVFGPNHLEVAAGLDNLASLDREN